MTGMKVIACAALLALALPAASQEARLEFEPRVGTTGTRVTITSPIPRGAVVRFGTRVVPLLVEPGRSPSFIVPEGVSSSFVEATAGGKVHGRSTVPFVVAGSSLINTPRLIGLKEAIDVFGYSEPIPEGGGKPEAKARRVLSFGDGDVLTIGESSALAPVPAVIGNDAASAATRGMGSAGFLFTARAPTRRTIIVPPPPPPPPVPTPTPAPTPSPG
ncbi:MAG: hypothetical protein HY900_26860 [Deltaproteobacteria bacterium]|nr:hypothetical protein [Deltaproteobacteria bacterium]